MLGKEEKPGTLGEFEVLALTGVVAAGDQAYGANIHEEIERLVAGQRHISIGAVYVTLERLEQKGYVKSWRGEPTAERGGKAKRYYEVQASGQLALKAALKPMVNAWAVLQSGASR